MHAIASGSTERPLHPSTQVSPMVAFLHNYSAIAQVENGHWYNTPNLPIQISPVLCALAYARTHASSVPHDFITRVDSWDYLVITLSFKTPR